MKRYSITAVAFLVAFIPAVALAFDLSGSTFEGVVNEIMDIIGLLNPVMIGLALIYFFWGLSKFILNSGKPEKIKEGRSYMLWGILALFVLISIQAIIGFVSSELEIGGKDPNMPWLKTTATTPANPNN